MPKQKQIILWPEYFSRRLSRGRGRRVPVNLAVDNLSPELFLKICDEMGLDCEIEQGKRYPRVWHSSYGYRIIVKVSADSDISKNALIKSFGEKLRNYKNTLLSKTSNTRT